jgi:tetratricopeptide (TPR) repeat protein
VAWCYAELGMFDKAATIARTNLVYCQSMAAQQAITYAYVNLGYILMHTSERAEGKALLHKAISECHAVSNHRLEGWAQAHVSTLEYLDSHFQQALEYAQEACKHLATSPGLRAWALATQARALLALGHTSLALTITKESISIAETLGGMLQGESLPLLVHARVLQALGHTEQAKHTAERAKRELEWRASFLQLPENQETLQLFHQSHQQRLPNANTFFLSQIVQAPNVPDNSCYAGSLPYAYKNTSTCYFQPHTNNSTLARNTR